MLHYLTPIVLEAEGWPRAPLAPLRFTSGRPGPRHPRFNEELRQPATKSVPILPSLTPAQKAANYESMIRRVHAAPQLDELDKGNLLGRFATASGSINALAARLRSPLVTAFSLADDRLGISPRAHSRNNVSSSARLKPSLLRWTNGRAWRVAGFR